MRDEIYDMSVNLWHALVMAKRKLTEQSIVALEPEGGRRKRLSDGRRLYIVAMPSGAKRWEAEFVGPDGRPHRHALGTWPEISLDEARRRHADLLAQISAGFLPAGRSHAESKAPAMRTVGLFAGIGGIERGLEAGCGARPVLLCELRPEAQAVLRRQFPDAEIVPDVRAMEDIPGDVDLLAAGFPCQDISVVGPQRGLDGERSILVLEVFRLLERATRRPEIVLLENVPHILSINNGSFMRFMTEWICMLGYRWAYRIIDPRSLGIPHRRPRFFLLAAKTLNPAGILFPKDEDLGATVCEAPGEAPTASAYGFYWTSGKIGVGWSRESIPPLKAGGLLSIPMAPAVWEPGRDFFGTPQLADLERLQGLPVGWTDLSGTKFKDCTRWGMLGNAVNATVSTWIGQRIRTGGDGGPRPERTRRIYPGSWPVAAYGGASGIWSVEASAYPAGINFAPILEFLQEPLKILSLKGTLGFRRRALESTQVRYPRSFLDSLDAFLRREYGWQGK